MTQLFKQAPDSDTQAFGLNMEARTKAHDWAATPLGAREGWPSALCFASDLMLASGHAMCLMWGPERVFLYNDTYAPLLGQRHPEALGLSAEKVWPEIWAEIEPLVDRTFAGETCTFEDLPLTSTRFGFEEGTFWTFSYSPVREEGGRIAGLLNVTSESSARIIARREREAAAARLRSNERFLSSVLAASTDCIKIVELDGTLSFMSEGGMETMEVGDFNAVKGCPWPDLLKDGGVGLAKDAIEAARHGRSSSFEMAADTLIGTPKYWSVTVSPILNDDGEVARMLSVSRDHTELEQARERQRLLNGELSHRMKNTLSVIQAIANQTLGEVVDRGAVEAFNQRLTALAAAHDVLLQHSWASAQLGDVARAVLRTFDVEHRFILAGPEIEMGPRATLAMSLMLHELATNATKYGALSSIRGKVALTWSIRRDADEETLGVSWVERGGPPAVQPTRKGFGSRIIRMGLIGSGGVSLHYGPEGLEVDASAPLDHIREA